MVLHHLLRGLLLLCLSSSATGQRNVGNVSKRNGVSSYISSEQPVSYQGILNNIGSTGIKAPGAADGIVIASPSRTDPNYYYTWIRDSALTYKTLIDRFIGGDKSLQQGIDNYVSAQAYLQNLTNPSGGPTTGGLGEPKFNVNKTAFTGPWGRPQRDGPALRTTALVSYARWLIDNGQTAKASQTVWPVVSKDMNYVVTYWNRTGFDLWEEVNGSSFFTLSAQHRALVEGTILAGLLGQQCPGCQDAAQQVLCFLDSFWTGNYIKSNINVNNGRSGLDVNSILSSINTFDPTANCTDSTFQPCSARALANHKAVVDSFRSIYAINSGVAQSQGVAIGRYPEDVYYGGNPWYLATFAAAEQLYDATLQWSKIGSITITEVSLPFFKDLISSAVVGTYPSSSPTFTTLISAVKAYADSFLAVTQTYTPSNGGLSEQYSRTNGTPVSAVDLTWSYAAFLTVAARHNGTVPAYSWDEPSNNVPPAKCVASDPCSANVSFTVKISTNVGDSVYVAGSVPALGNWSPGHAVLLSAVNYTASNPIWQGHVQIPAGEDTTVQYKYILKTGDGTISWESDPNRSFSPGLQCGGTVTLADTWR